MILSKLFFPLCALIILDQMKIINAFPVYFKGLGEQMEQMLEYPLEITNTEDTL